MTEAVKLLQKMSVLANFASVAGAAGTAAKLLELSKAIIDDQRNPNVIDAILNGLDKVKYNLMKAQGAKIWVNFSGECCVNQRCCGFFTRLNWVVVEAWYSCTLNKDWPFDGLVQMIRKG